MLENTQLKCSKGLYAYFSQYNSTSISIYRQCIKHKATTNNERGQNHLHVYTISRFLTNIHFSYFPFLQISYAYVPRLCITSGTIVGFLFIYILRTKNIHNKSMKFIGHPLCTGIRVDIQYLEGSKSIISFTQSSSLNLYFFSLDTPRWVQYIYTNSKICLCFENYWQLFKFFQIPCR